ncbi:MAG: carboxypeptidase regulatory-like domain-containing protein [candidate division Zixibacteria bacterium]|nr:carboxypeptidase regulatory-like domain-containing protein [candidate division Zixibacteria bacterium]
MRKRKPHTHSIGRTAIVLVTVLGILSPIPASAQTEFEEIVVKFEVPKLSKTDILAQYDGRTIYLPLIEIFGFLDIIVKSDFDNGKFSGKFVMQDNDFEINIRNGETKCFGRTMQLADGSYYLSATDLFLRIDLFEHIFKLRPHFNFSQLSVYLSLDKDFPAYRKLLRKAAHEKLKDRDVAARDVQNIPYQRDHLKAGVADWMLSACPYGGAGHYFTLGMGGMVMGGDLAINGSVNSINGFESDNVTYLWHYYFNDNEYITQAEIGDINTQGSLSRSLDGVQLTNKPPVQRKYFQTVKVEGYAGEGWEVELYVNNQLSEFAYADENGNYSFLIDTYYGASQITLKLYGPNGEIKTEEQYVRVPYNLIPKNDYEYSIAGGVKPNTTDNAQKKYAQATAYYGLLSSLTVGGVVDMPVAVEDGEKPTYAGEISFQPLGTVLFGASFSPDNALEGNFSYNRPSLLTINAQYAGFYENPFRNKLNRKYEYSLAISSPLRIKNKYFGPRYRVSITQFEDYQSINMNYGFKLPLYKLSTTYLGAAKLAKYFNRTERSLTSQIFITTQFLRWLRPQFKLNYDHELNQLSQYAVYLHRRIFKRGQLTFTYERNEVSETNRIMISFNIFNDFANITSRVNVHGDQVIATQLQRGSILFDQDSKSFRLDRRYGLGRGTAVIWPFLDENYNGRYDEGEEVLKDLKASIGGARGVRNSQNGLYYYDGLRAYDEYLVEIDEYSLDNPMLRPAHQNFKVTINPNTVTSISVPIVTAGEVGGIVERAVETGRIGVGGIKLIILNEVTGQEIPATTFNDGSYYYMGLVPGLYRVTIDAEQLKRYGYHSDPRDQSFQIKAVEGGDIVGGIDFLIVPD